MGVFFVGDFRSTIPGGVELVFCSDQSADTWIVREVDVLQAEGKVPQASYAGLLFCCCPSIYRILIVTPCSLAEGHPCPTPVLKAVSSASTTV